MVLFQEAAMANEDNTYTEQLTNLQKEVLGFLRTFESVQEELRPNLLAECQGRLVGAVGDTFRRFEASFVALAPPASMTEMHQRLCAAIRELAKAYEVFMSKPGPQWTLAFLHSRAAFCRGLYQLYDLRDELPIIGAHFLLAGAKAPKASTHSGAPTGFIQRQRNQERSDYTLYIPEDYLRDKPLPLIIALHGGYGQGYEYIWTWLRSARSRGYAVLAPKSFGDTWDMSTPSIDTRSVLKMLDEISSEYSIDRARIYLTGLSDGGIFTYILGLDQSQLFRSLAPVAGVLHQAVDQTLRQGRGKDTPIFVVHGVHDFIFPVSFTRQTCKLLKDIGYQVTYEELPEWGHAYPYSINERLVLPWFESLPPKHH
jgi:phospholipase/carboxylesterase